MHQVADQLFRRFALMSFCFYMPLAYASDCPTDFSEWLHTTTVDAATVQVCVSNQDRLGIKQLQLTLSSKTQQLRSTVPLDIEGNLRAIELAPASYALQPGKRALALLLQLRNRGVGFDEERRELWLFWPAAGQLHLVFNQSIELQHWATQCSPDCDDTVHSRSELRVLGTTNTKDAPAAAFAPLELRTQGEVVPASADDSHAEKFERIERFEFSGERYELLPVLP